MSLIQYIRVIQGFDVDSLKARATEVLMERIEKAARADLKEITYNDLLGDDPANRRAYLDAAAEIEKQDGFKGHTYYVGEAGRYRNYNSLYKYVISWNTA